MRTKYFDAVRGLEDDLAAAKAAGLYRTLRVVDPGIRRGESTLLNFSDNDYLGLAAHPRVVAAFKDAADVYGVGAGASRLISGTSPAHELLERELACFKKKERALVFGSGYLANLGIVSALVRPGDLVIIDKLNHASIIDACKLSGASLRVYPHKNTKKLDAVLSQSRGMRRRLIVTDSVFSMDGDLAPLREIVRIKEHYEAMLMIDEAHGTGVFGKCGRGVAEHLGVEAGIDISMGTLSKSVGVFGGFAAGSRALIDCLVNFSRPFIFATAPPAALMRAALEGLRLIEKEPALREKLWRNVALAKEELQSQGWDWGASESPIIPLHIGGEDKAVAISKSLQEKGILLPAVRFPAVARGKARLRLTVSARHSTEDLRRLFRALRAIRELL